MRPERIEIPEDGAQDAQSALSRDGAALALEMQLERVREEAAALRSRVQQLEGEREDIRRRLEAILTALDRLRSA